jgi:hypothetical protein
MSYTFYKGRNRGLYSFYQTLFSWNEKVLRKGITFGIIDKRMVQETPSIFLMKIAHVKE